jgi:hypothetical protein
MNITFQYRGRSHIREQAGAQVVSLSPNLSRDTVAFDAALKQPLLFREAISALHDVVINDLRHKPKDKTAYKAWQRDEAARHRTIFSEARQQAAEERAARAGQPLPQGLERDFKTARKTYWSARNRYDAILRKEDPTLWRLLLPYDPVITVAPDVVMFECFSADEATYGCLTVERDDCFSTQSGVQCGTTNVDYSWALFDHFQTLRSYQPARFNVDPTGFGVAIAGSGEHREEKIDLPSSWLQGFMQLQGAMSLPTRSVTLSQQGMYSLLAWIRRHKAQRSPRALRFEILEGRPPELVLEPWEQRIVDRGAPLPKQTLEPIRIWGTRRLLSLARVLPLTQRVDVHLLGTGLPSLWVMHMGPMKLTLALSGWTANDWTHGSAVDLLAAPTQPAPEFITRVADRLHQRNSASLLSLSMDLAAEPRATGAALKQLAHRGQVIQDFGHGVYRWRQIMPQVMAEEQLGPENPELVASRSIIAAAQVTLLGQSPTATGATLYVGKSSNRDLELVMDADGTIRRGNCDCSHHFKAGIRRGPCRHLLAFRHCILNPVDLKQPSLYDRLWSRFSTQL